MAALRPTYRHLLLSCGILFGCAAAAPGPGSSTAEDAESSPPALAIGAVLAADEEAAGARNHFCENMPLHEAIIAYLDELEALDYGDCPADFTAAFRRHREAWRDSLDFFVRYSELRGEMHEVFEQIRAREPDALQAVEAEIWGTWDEVEAAARRHGSIAADED